LVLELDLDFDFEALLAEDPEDFFLDFFFLGVSVLFLELSDEAEAAC
jgi:hypothetical protein